MRYCTDDDLQRRVPVHVVWELTLACDLRCHHCGSRAGRPRPSELTTRDCLEIVDALARLGTREVSLIGGEAYLRDDWTEIIRAIRSHGMYCAVQTGGRHLTPARLAAAVDAGLNGLGVSLDGLEPLHDRLRGVPGSFAAAVDALRRASAAGVRTSVNTQIGAETIGELFDLLDIVHANGARHWQLQLTVPIGNVVEHAELMLQPYQLLEVMPALARLYTTALDRDVLVAMGNNVGYFGPYEHLWRGFGDERIHWSGCSAGQTLLALESDGTVKGCPSLPTVGYAGGNVKEMRLEDVWARSDDVRFRESEPRNELWGWCRTCYYADVCDAGCTWMSHSLLGRRGNNPYCHHRALSLAKAGRRERIVKVADAAAAPFAVGRFDLVLETASGDRVIDRASPPCPVIPLRSVRAPKDRSPRVPPNLDLCRACDCYIWPGEQTCPHCAADVRQAAETYAEDARRRQRVKAAVARLLELMENGGRPDDGAS